MRKILFVFMLLFFMVSIAFADVIHLKNGKTVKGVVTKEDEDEITVLMNIGTMTFSRSEIESIEKTKELPKYAERYYSPDTQKKQEKPDKTSEISIEQATKAVVNINAYYLNEDSTRYIAVKQGSGFIIDSNGTIVTNNHVVYKADKILVKLPGQKKEDNEYDARIIKTSIYYDLALINIVAFDLPSLSINDDPNIEVGDEVRAIGNPEGFNSTFTKGIVSAIRTNEDMNSKYREVEGDYINPYNWENMTWIQTDAAINQGNSGGPLLNADNQIIGINTKGHIFAEGLNFALHIKHVQDFARGY